MNKDKLGIVFAILAALCYSLINPINKLFNSQISPLFSASMLYFGTFIVGVVFLVVQLIGKKPKEEKFTQSDIPYLVAAIAFHIGACVSLMFGLTYLSSSNASLLGSFEIISSSLIALVLFKEKISKYLWIGIGFIFVACVIISLGDLEHLNFSIGSLLCLISPILMGFANNFLKKVSNKNPGVTLGTLGLSGGVITLGIALIMGQASTSFVPIVVELSIGVVSYGIALILFIYAERFIGTAKTSAFFSIAPFIAIILSLIIFSEKPNYTFFIGLALMVVGTIFASMDVILKKYTKVEK